MSLDSSAKKAGLTLTPSLKAAVHDGNAYSVMAGAGEGYLSAFAIFLGGTPLQLAFLTSLPALLGAAGQLTGLWLLGVLKSRRGLICQAALVHALVWLPIASIPWAVGNGPWAVWALLGCLVLYYSSGGIGSPPWNSLIGDLVPENIRGAYFGFRNRLMGLFTFLAMVLAGQVLQVASLLEGTAIGYGIIFFVACVARLISRYWLLRYEDPPHPVSSTHYFSFFQFVRRAPSSNFARFVIYISIINGAVAFSAPFFTLYMLRDLKFSYLEFTLTAAASVLVQCITMQYWGRLADLFGSKKLLNILGFGVVVAPLLWLMSDSFWFIILIQFFSGATWAGFNLAAATFLFAAVTPAKRARCTAYQAVMNSILVTVGAVAGGWLVGHLPESISVAGVIWMPQSPLIFLFAVSGVLRLIASVVLLPRFREVSEVQPIPHRELLFHITGLRPISGVTFGLLADERRVAGRRSTLKKGNKDKNHYKSDADDF